VRERFCGADGAVNATDVTTLDATSAEAPDPLVAVANALKNNPDEASEGEIVYVTELDPPELALRVLEVVGGLEAEAKIRTLKELGDPDQPVVLAVRVVPWN
jgi:hypothetical protein